MNSQKVSALHKNFYLWQLEREISALEKHGNLRVKNDVPVSTYIMWKEWNFRIFAKQKLKSNCSLKNTYIRKGFCLLLLPLHHPLLPSPTFPVGDDEKNF